MAYLLKLSILDQRLLLFQLVSMPYLATLFPPLPYTCCAALYSKCTSPDSGMWDIHPEDRGVNWNLAIQGKIPTGTYLLNIYIRNIV
jgi:hypothetical protein